MLHRWLSHSASDRALHPARCECSTTPLWETQISQEQRKLLQSCILIIRIVAKCRQWAIRICSSHVLVVPRSENSLLHNTFYYSAMILLRDVLHSPVLTESLQTHKQCHDLFPYKYVTPLSANNPDGSFSAGEEIKGTDSSLVSASTPFPNDKFSSSGHIPFLIFFTLTQFIAYFTKVAQ
jgi:hypothetical protein